MNLEETQDQNNYVPIKKTVFQTLANRDTEKIELAGPFPCYWENTWLGDGYYFWDTFIENAHFWGATARANTYKNGYIICEAKCDFNTHECLDLHGDLEQLKVLKDIFELYKSIGKSDKKTTVKEFLALLKGEFPDKFSFTAIRANGINSKSSSSPFTVNVLFEKGKHKQQYFEMIPAVQICFFTKQSMNLRDYKIVFPLDLVNL